MPELPQWHTAMSLSYPTQNQYLEGRCFEPKPFQKKVTKLKTRQTSLLNNAKLTFKNYILNTCNRQKYSNRFMLPYNLPPVVLI
jgi:hypothetical protein